MAAPRVLTASSSPARPATRPRSLRTLRTVVLWLAVTGPAALLYGAFVLWPLVRVLWLSLQHWSGYGAMSFAGLGNYGKLVTDSVFHTELTHTLLWELGAAVGLTVVALGLALLIRLGRVPVLALSVLFLPALLPATVVAAIWTLVYSPLSGGLNTLLRAVGLPGLALDWLGDPHLAPAALFVAWSWSCIGIGALIFWAALSSLSPEYVDLARVEGAGIVWRFSHVLLPHLRRSIGLVAIINAALGLQVFDIIFVTTGGGPGYSTLTLPIDVYGRAFGGNVGGGAAVATTDVILGLLLACAAVLLLRGEGSGMNSGEGSRPPAGSATRTLGTVSTVLLVAVILLPLGWLVASGLGWTGSTIGPPSPTVDPRTWGWQNFVSVWNAGMGGAILSSAGIALAVMIATLLLALPAACALLSVREPARFAILAILVVGLFQPTAVLIIPLFDLLKGLGLLDTVWGVVLPEVARNLAFAVLLLWAFLAQLPDDVMGAALVDGATPVQQMARVAIPMAWPAVFAVALWAFVTSWNEYLLPTVVSQDGSLQTVPTLLGGFVGSYDTQYALLAAGAVLATVPLLALYLVLRAPIGHGLRRLERSI